MAECMFCGAELIGGRWCPNTATGRREAEESSPASFYVVSNRRNLYMAGPLTYRAAHARRDQIGHGSHVVTGRGVNIRGEILAD